MRTISQRQLRNDSGEIMRGLMSGESYRLTSRGVPVGVLGPAERSARDEQTLRWADHPMEFPEGVRVPERVEDVLAELRDEP